MCVKDWHAYLNVCFHAYISVYVHASVCVFLDIAVGLKRCTFLDICSELHSIHTSTNIFLSLHDAMVEKWNDSPESQAEQFDAISETLPEFMYMLETRITQNDSRYFVQRQLYRCVLPTNCASPTSLFGRNTGVQSPVAYPARHRL